MNSEPHLAEECKAIRDKKERFFDSEKWREEVSLLRRCPVCKRQLAGSGRGAVTASLPPPSQERSGDGRAVSGVRDKPWLEMLAPQFFGFPGELIALKH